MAGVLAAALNSVFYSDPIKLKRENEILKKATAYFARDAL
jgi:transposase-like protein